MSPGFVFSIITIILGILAALNYFYFNNMPFAAILTFLALIFVGITAFTFFGDD